MTENRIRRAKKIGGSYQADGTIVSTFATLAGETRHVFEFDQPAGMLHIFGPGQVEIAASVAALAAAPAQAQEPYSWVLENGAYLGMERGAVNPWKGSAGAFPLYRAPVQPVAVPQVELLLAALNNIAEACNCCGDRSDLAVMAQEALDEYADAAPAAQGEAKDAERWRYFRDSETLCGEVWEEIMHPDERGIKFHAKELDYWVDAAIAAKAANK